jgi:hypothetical protein
MQEILAGVPEAIARKLNAECEIPCGYQATKSARPSAKNCVIFPLATFEGWFLAYLLESEHVCMRYDPAAWPAH